MRQRADTSAQTAADTAADISVVVPSYDDADECSRLVGELARQSLRPREIVLVDDGSRAGRRLDDVPGLAGPATAVGIEVVLVFRQHAGAAAARNAGVARARCRLVFFCDADVRLQATCLERLHEAIARSGADLAYCRFDHGRGTRILGEPFDRQALRTGNYIGGVALARRDALPQDGRDPRLLRFQDWDHWQRMLIRDRREAVFVPDVLFHARRRPGGISSEHNIPHAEARRIVLEKQARWDVPHASRS